MHYLKPMYKKCNNFDIALDLCIKNTKIFTCKVKKAKIGKQNKQNNRHPSS